MQSRARQFYYAHPQNRFWRMLAAVFGEAPPITEDEKRDMLRRKHIALWNVLYACAIEGSSDASIRDAVPNDFSVLFQSCPVSRILCNGGKAYDLFLRLAPSAPGIPVYRMPSTSPANAAWSLTHLVDAWRESLQEN